ncbi:vacuolar transporter chaperone 4, partial [Reticulomyxa filosa]
MTTSDKNVEKVSLLGDYHAQGQGNLSKQIAYSTFQEDTIPSAQSNLIEDEKDIFLRKTSKYWVKKRVAKQIPEWRYDNKVTKNLAESGNIIHSIYFDTNAFDLYDSRITQEASSMLFRYRWYVNEKPTRGYFEQKLRRSMWGAVIPIKRRFQLAPHLVVPYVHQGVDVTPQYNSLMQSIHKLHTNANTNTCKHIFFANLLVAIFIIKKKKGEKK